MARPINHLSKVILLGSERRDVTPEQLRFGIQKAQTLASQGGIATYTEFLGLKLDELGLFPEGGQ